LKVKLEEILPDEEIKERGLDQKRKISHAGLHCYFFIFFLPFGSRKKRRHPSFRHNSCFALIFK
jgi:hypothetical protein